MKAIQVILFTLFCLHLFSQDCLNMEGKWINELGSVLVIDRIQSDGEIVGNYASSTGVDGKIFPMQGWINASEINPAEINVAFTVRWEGYGSITSWTGYCLEEDGVASIKTIWNLVRSGKEFPWERILTNSSTFTAEK